MRASHVTPDRQERFRRPDLQRDYDAAVAERHGVTCAVRVECSLEGDALAARAEAEKVPFAGALALSAAQTAMASLAGFLSENLEVNAALEMEEAGPGD